MPKVSAQKALGIETSLDYDPDQHVCAAYIHGEYVDAFFMRALLNLTWWDASHERRLVVPKGDGFNLISVNSGPLIARARNSVVEQWLEHFPWANWLLMVDSDMVFEPQALDFLLAHADPVHTPILGALCFSVGQQANQVQYKKLPTMLRFNEDASNFERVSSGFVKGDIVEVDATGTAFLLVHKSVFEKIKRPGYYPWFFESERVTEKSIIGLGEDVSFCLLAQGAGFPIKVHTGIHVLHRKVLSI